MQCVNCERVIEGGEALGGGGDKQVKTRPERPNNNAGGQFNRPIEILIDFPIEFC